MTTKRWLLAITCGMLLCVGPYRVTAASPPGDELSAAQQEALQYLDRNREVLWQLNRKIWEYAEVGLQERQSAAAIVHLLRKHGFDVEVGVADMPTAFVASFGSGRPIIGILAEYDALPGLSQDTVPERKPFREGGAGHACGHSALGSAAVGAALAIKHVLEQRGLSGTIRLYGTPAEETGIGKVYMLRAGLFRDLDVCFHWHPGGKNQVLYSSSKAISSVKFTFHGIAAHASASPHDGRSALDAVELMNIGVNYMREHVKEDARFHYVITDGGGQPNVVPPRAQVWYYIRANRHEDMERYARWIMDIARAAAMMTQTKVDIEVVTDNHELIPNRPLSELLYRVFQQVGPPQFTEQERAFARMLQEPLEKQLGKRFAKPLDDRIAPLPKKPGAMKGSTDVGDISWFVPTSGIGTACFPYESPGHSWQNVAAVGSSIGNKGLLVAAKVLAASAIALYENPELIEPARRALREQLKGRTYRTLIPEGQRPPRSIR